MGPEQKELTCAVDEFGKNDHRIYLTVMNVAKTANTKNKIKSTRRRKQ